MARIFLFLLAATAFAFAQDTPGEAPTPAATPEVSATPEAPVSPEAAPAPVETAPAPTATPDTIPMEGQPTAPPPPPVSGGAPLDTQDLAPALPDAAFTDPNAIIPDGAPVPPALPTAVENAQEKERNITIRYREVRVQVDRDPAVANLLDQANAAKTDEDKRAALREYYRLLFKKMVAVDKSIEARCKIMEDAYLRRLSQQRIEPTIPLNPPPTPAPLSN